MPPKDAGDGGRVPSFASTRAEDVSGFEFLGDGPRRQPIPFAQRDDAVFYVGFDVARSAARAARPPPAWLGNDVLGLSFSESPSLWWRSSASPKRMEIALNVFRLLGGGSRDQ